MRYSLLAMKHFALLSIISLLFVSCTGTPEAPVPVPPPPSIPVIEPPAPSEPSPASAEGMLEENSLTFGEGLQQEQAPPPASVTPIPPPPSAEKRVIPVSVASWSFSPARISVKRGELVEVQLQGVSGIHGFSLPGLGINVPISPEETKTVAIPTDTPGTFEGLCSIPCGAGHRDMHFTVTVEP